MRTQAVRTGQGVSQGRLYNNTTSPPTHSGEDGIVLTIQLCFSTFVLTLTCNRKSFCFNRSL